MLLAVGEIPLSQHDGIMARFDHESHSFVIRLWQEHQEHPDAPLIWRGWVEHVQSGMRHYFQSVAALNDIVFDYLGKEPELNPLFSNLETRSHVQ